jgi:hypothetical protein
MPTIQELQTQKEQLLQARNQNLNISNEPIPQKRYGSRVTRTVQDEYVVRKNQADNNVQVIQNDLVTVDQAIKAQQDYEAQKKIYDEQVASVNRQKQAMADARSIYVHKGLPGDYSGTDVYPYLQELYENNGGMYSAPAPSTSAIKEPVLDSKGKVLYYNFVEPTPPEPGGYYVNNKTGLGFATKEDMTTKSKDWVQTAKPSEIASGKVFVNPQAPNLVLGQNTGKFLSFSQQPMPEIPKPINPITNLARQAENKWQEQFTSTKPKSQTVSGSEYLFIKGKQKYDQIESKISQGLIKLSPPTAIKEFTTLATKVNPLGIIGGSYKESKIDKGTRELTANLWANLAISYEKKPLTQLANIAISRGLGKLASAGTEITYTIADLPKVETKFLTQELSQQGENIWLKTVAKSNVKGLVFEKQVVTGSISQARFTGTINDLNKFESATIGVQREQNLLMKQLGRWSKPIEFGTAEVGATKEITLKKAVGKLQGIDVYQQTPVTAFSSISKTKLMTKKPIETLYANMGYSKPVNELEAVWSYSKPVEYNQGALKLGAGRDYSFGFVSRAKPETEFINLGGQVLKGGKSSSPLLASQEKAIASMAKASLIQSSSNKADLTVRSINQFIPKPTKSNNQVTMERTVSKYYGTGQYELTELKVFNFSKFSSIETQSNLVNLGQLSNQNLGQLSRQNLGLRQNELSIQSLKQPTNLMSNLRTNSISKYRTMQLSILKPKQTTRTVSSSMFKLPIPRSIKATPIVVGGVYSNDKIKKRTGTFEDLYKTEIKRKGKWYDLPGERSKGEAIQFGESKALNTLARSFRIEGTGNKGLVNPTTYNPSQAFRPYKIRGKQKIPLTDTWIQKARFSLSSFGEKSEIKQARRSKR